MGSNQFANYNVAELTDADRQAFFWWTFPVWKQVTDVTAKIRKQGMKLYSDDILKKDKDFYVIVSCTRASLKLLTYIQSLKFYNISTLWELQ